MGVIPQRLHFIFGLTPDFGGKPFSFVHWAAIRSALAVNPGWTATVWCKHEPTGRYWEAIRPHVDVQPIEPAVEVYGNPIPHVAHKCDWARLVVLSQHGGVYLDCDTISVASFDRILTPPATMFTEFVDGKTIGLCNAFIAAEKGSTFIHKWMEKFRGFRSQGRDGHWNESAVKWPHELWRKDADVIALMSHYFMVPDWTPKGIGDMFERVEEFPAAVGHHLWESFTWEPYLKHFTPENYVSRKCTYTGILQRVLGDEIDRTF